MSKCHLRGNNVRIKQINPVIFFLVPSFAGFAVFYIIPFIISLYYSFITKPVGGSFAGLDNYLGLMQNASYIKGLINTISFILLCVPLNMCVSLCIALLVNKAGRFKELFVLIFLIPLVIPSGATVFFWNMTFSYNGFINGLLNNIGAAKINWLDTSKARVVMAIIFLWKNMGYNMVLFMSGLNNIPHEYYEAADVDGACAFRKFTGITAYNLLPTVVLVTIMTVINSFKVFKEVYLILGSYPHDSVYMLQHFMNNMFFSLNYQKLTTATTILITIMALPSSLLLRFERRRSDA